MRRLLFGLSVALGGLVTGCGESAPPTTRITGPTMGTSFTVLVPDRAFPGDAQNLRPPIEKALERVNERMSTYRRDSEVSRFNRSRETGDWFSVSGETARVVSFALDVSRRTGGAFDVTVGPLVNLWRFGPDDAEEAAGTAEAKVPDDARITALLARVGHDKLACRTSPPGLKKRVPELAIDLSAIAKGHAVDAVAGVLDAAGVTHYFVDVGGEIRTRGARADGTPWRLGIEAPRFDRRAVHRVLRFAGDVAVATSGDYRNYRTIDGRRYGHTIDPRTGRPVDASPPALCSVTVAAPTCMEADALATALMVMGWKPAAAFAEKEGLATLLIARTADGELVERESTAFAKRLAEPSRRGDGPRSP